MTSDTHREANCEAKAERLAEPASDSGQVMMIVLGDCWVEEVP